MATYLENVDQVLQAGERFVVYLQADSDEDRAYGAKQLEEAAERTHAAGLAFRFTESTAGRTPADAASAAPQSDDLLASALVDIDAANVLIAAGYAMGDGQTSPGDPAHLRNALQSLEQTRDLLGGSDAPVAFGFTARPTADATGPSADLPSARSRFQEAAERTLDAIVVGAEQAATAVVKALGKLDPANVRQALGSLGERAANLVSAASRLVRKGLDLLAKTLDGLISGLGTQALAQIRERAQKLWDDIKGGAATRSLLGVLFGTARTKQRIPGVLDGADLSIEALDRGADALAALGTRFDKTMVIVDRIVTGLGVALAVAVFLPIAAPTVAATGLSLYATVLAAVVLIGIDASDSGRLGWQRGVGEIVDGVAPRRAHA